MSMFSHLETWFKSFLRSIGMMDPGAGGRSAGSSMSFNSRGNVSDEDDIVTNTNATATNPFGVSQSSFSSGSVPSLFGALTNFLNNLSGEHMTNAEVERNQMQMQNEEDIYQRQVAGMQKAGINPALMYGSGAQSAPAVNTSNSSVGASMSDLMQLATIKPTIDQMKANAQMMRDQGKAALMNAKSNERTAGANEQNAQSNARNAGANESQARSAEFRAETDRMRQEVEAWRAKYDIQVSEETAKKLAEETAQIKIFSQQLPDRLAILKQEADAHTRQSYASLESAVAAARQAAVSEKLSDSEIALRESQVFVNWANGDGQEIVNKYLDDKQMAELKELGSRSDFLQANVRYLDRQSKVQWMQTITGYTNSACNIANTVFNGFGTFSGMGSRPSIGF